MAFFQTSAGFGTTNAILAQTPTGAPVAGSFHLVLGTVNINASSTVTVTLTGGAVFTLATSYAVAVSTDDTNATHQTYVFNQTNNSFQIHNPDGGGAHNYQFVAVGV